MRYLKFLKIMGPGIVVAIGFIDPGNWGSSILAGSSFGYKLLWVVTLSTIMLILLQNNVASLGIVTKKCLAENTSEHLPSKLSSLILFSAFVVAVSTALAEILGASVALNMLFSIPIKVSAIIVLALCLVVLFLYNYNKLQSIIVFLMMLISISFFVELYLIKDIHWGEIAVATVVPVMPIGSIVIIISILGAVVMPHNLFLHSYIVGSNSDVNKLSIEKQKKYSFLDTIFSMVLGWAINCAIIILAAATFYTHGITVTEIEQTKDILTPIAGATAGIIFAFAFFLAGFSSSVTSAMSGGYIFHGFLKKIVSIKHSKSIGIALTLLLASVVLFFVQDPLKGLVYSQVVLSIQLPITIFLQIYLTSSKKIMGKYTNSKLTNVLLCSSGFLVSFLNLLLLYSLFKEGF